MLDKHLDKLVSMLISDKNKVDHYIIISESYIIYL